MQLVRQLRARQLRPALDEQRRFYAAEWTTDAIRDWQLDQFQRQWEVIRCRVPYFRRMFQERRLPERIRSWFEFQQLFPLMDRDTVQKERDALTMAGPPPDYRRSTGGSTAQPVQIPAWRSERAVANQDFWYARAWHGISPADKLFLIWGHSHLLGKGLRGWLNRRVRQVKDRLLGYYRCSAYDLSDGAVRAAAQALLKFRPQYVLGYAVALDRFAYVNRDLQTDFHRLGFKAVIATAESFPRPSSARIVEQTMGCPVIMEYGAVETGPIAYQASDGVYRVFWRHYLVEALDCGGGPGRELVVTSLYDRCFPLVRYRLGDLIACRQGRAGPVDAFDAVLGRCNDYVVIDQTVIHSEAFAHAVKDFPAVAAYHVRQSKSGDVVLGYVSPTVLSGDEIHEIRRRLRTIHSALDAVRIERLVSVPQTMAGKTSRVVREYEGTNPC